MTCSWVAVEIQWPAFAVIGRPLCGAAYSWATYLAPWSSKVLSLMLRGVSLLPGPSPRLLTPSTV
jgi:hypothetical protein